MNKTPVLTSPAKLLSAGMNATPLPHSLPRQGNLTIVASGKGGVGKTWFSITLSQALAATGGRVLLMDGDLGLANVDVQLAMSPDHDLASVVSGKIDLADAITPYGNGAIRFDVLAGRSGSGALDTLSRKEIDNLCNGLIRTAVLYDHVIVDLAAGMNSHMTPLYARMGKALIVVTDDPTSLTDAYAMIKYLAGLHPGLDIRIIINMADSRAQAEKTFGAVNRACEHFLQFTPKMAGYIVRDKHVTQAIRAQAPLLSRYPQSEAAMLVQQIASSLHNNGPRGLV